MGIKSTENIARGFMIAAILYGLVGVGFGLQMAISQDTSQLPTHAHINLIGWVSFFLFALFYHLFGEKVSTLLARVHFWLAQISALGLFTGLTLIYAGETQFEPLAAISAMGYGASFLVFAFLALTGLSRKR